MIGNHSPARERPPELDLSALWRLKIADIFRCRYHRVERFEKVRDLQWPARTFIRVNAIEPHSEHRNDLGPLGHAALACQLVRLAAVLAPTTPSSALRCRAAV